MAKTITIQDDVYELLVKTKGKASFSKAIENLIRMAGSRDRELLLRYFGISKEFPDENRNKKVRRIEALR